MTKEISRRSFFKLGVLGLVGAGFSGMALWVDKRLDAMEDSQKEAASKDETLKMAVCVNESILRQAFGAPTLNYEQCQEEWESWRKAYDEEMKKQNGSSSFDIGRAER